MKFKQFVAIAAFTALGSVSNFAAASTTYGSFTEAGAPTLVSAFDGHGIGSASVITGAFPFDYTYNFNLASTSEFTTLVNGWWGITGMTGTIAGTGGPTITLNTDGNNLTFGAYSGYSSYSLHFTGTSPDPTGGFNVQINSVAAVPEPETYALLLAGLGLIGLVTRRRNKLSVA
jgi:hypothetical protein